MTQHWGKIIYLLSFFTLIIGFYLGEDGTGKGLTQDFYSTWKFVEALKYDFFADPSEITLHFPLHYFLLSKLNYLISDFRMISENFEMSRIHQNFQIYADIFEIS